MASIFGIGLGGRSGSLFGKLSKNEINDIVNTVIGEAGGEGAKGMAAVASVIKNRSELRGKSPAEIVAEPHQFAAYSNPGDQIKKDMQDPALRAEAMTIVQSVFDGKMPDPTDGADHYHADGATPDWANSMPETTKIGNHIFYRSAPPPKAVSDANVPGLPSNVPVPAFRPDDRQQNAPSEAEKPFDAVLTPDGKAQGGLSPIDDGRKGIWAPVGNFVAHGEDNVNPALVDILKTTAEQFPGYRVEAFSGYRPGDKRQHGKHEATDIRLIDEKTGKEVPNYQDAGGFRIYEQFAQKARQVQMEKYPDLSNNFRWGGYFSGQKGKYGAVDLMHFDLGGSPTLGMAGGSWDDGLTSLQRSYFPGVVSVGMRGQKLDTKTAPAQSKSIVLDDTFKPANGLGIFGDGGNSLVDMQKANEATADATQAAASDQAEANRMAGFTDMHNREAAATANQLNQQQPGRYEVMDPAQADQFQQDWQTKNQSSGIAGDTVRNWTIGAASGAQQLGNVNRLIISKLPYGDKINAALDNIDRWFTGGMTSDELNKAVIEKQQAELSPEGKAAAEKKWWDGDKGWFGPAWSDPRSYIAMTAQSAPSTIATMLPSGMMARGAYLGKLAAGAAPEVAAAAAAKTAAIAGGLGEGFLGGAQSAQTIKDEIAGMPREQLAQSDAVKALVSQGMSEDQAIAAISSDAQTQAFVVTGVTTGIFGGMGDRALAKILAEGIGGGVVKRTVRGMIRGAVSEGVLEELPQNVTQQMSENAAMQKVDPNRSIMQDVPEAAASGLAGGVAMGGTMGGVAGVGSPAETHSAGAPEDAAAVSDGYIRVAPEGQQQEADAPAPQPVQVTKEAGPIGRSVGHAERSIAQRAQDVQTGAPVPTFEKGATVRVDEPGIEPFMGTVDSIDGNDAIIMDSSSGELLQVPARSLTQIASSPADIKAGKDENSLLKPKDALPEQSSDPALEPAPPQAAEVTTEPLPPPSQQKPATERFPSAPKPGERVIVDDKAGQRFAGTVRSYENGGQEAVVETDDGKALQVKTDQLYVSNQTKEQIAAEDAKRNPPVQRDTSNAGPDARNVNGKTVVMPDDLHARLYDLGRERLISKKTMGASQLDLGAVGRDSASQIAKDFGISPEAAGSLADDYRFRVERSAKNAQYSGAIKMPAVDPRRLRQWQREQEKATGAAPAATNPDADWWDGQLTAQERRKVLDAAGVKRSERMQWAGFTPAIREKLLAQRKSASYNSGALSNNDSKGTDAGQELQTRNEGNAGVHGVGSPETTVSQPKEPGLSPLRSEGDNRSPNMADGLPGILSGDRSTPVGEALSGQDQRGEGIRAGERSLGNGRDAGAEPPEVRAQNRGKDDRGNSSTGEDSARNSETQAEKRHDAKGSARDPVENSKNADNGQRGDGQLVRLGGEDRNIKGSASSATETGGDAGASDHQPLSEVDAKAHEAATSPLNTTPEPSPDQKRVNNYKLGHVKLGGLDISVENPAGSTRSGVDGDGKPWSVEMKSHYGYIKGTVGRDKDHVDIFVKPGTETLDDAAPVYVVDQVSPDGRFDEHKILAGFDSKESARRAYLENYTKGWKGLGNLTETTLGDFKAWLENGDTTKPFSRQPEQSSAERNVSANESAKAQEARSILAGVPDGGTVKFTGMGDDLQPGTWRVEKIGANGQATLRAMFPGAQPTTFSLAELKRETRDDGRFEAVDQPDKPTDRKPRAEKKKLEVSENTVFTEDAAQKARELLRRKLGTQLNSGIDPEIMQAGITLAGYHIERGARTFAAFAKAMLADLGEDVRPYLKSWYAAASLSPDLSSREGLTPLSELDGFNIDTAEDEQAASTEPSDGATAAAEESPTDSASSAASSLPHANASGFGQDKGVEPRSELKQQPKLLEPISNKKPDPKITQVEPGFISRRQPPRDADEQIGFWARNSVLNDGQRSGYEYVVAIDDTGSVVEYGTSRHPTRTGISQRLAGALWNPDRRLALYHNHPRNTPLSTNDLSILAFPGAHLVVANGHKGRNSSATLTVAAADRARRMGEFSLRKLIDGARDDFINGPMRPAIEAADSEAIAQALPTELASRAGIIDYQDNLRHDFSRIPELDAAIDKAAENLKREFYGSEDAAREADARLRRSTDTVRHIGSLEAVAEGRQQPSGDGRRQSGLAEGSPPNGAAKERAEIERDYGRVAATKDNIVAAVKGAIEDKHPSILATVPLNYFPELANGKLPAIDDYLLVKRKMDAYRSDRHEQAAAIIDKWRKYISLGLFRNNEAKAAHLSGLMHDSTLAGIDPSEDRSKLPAEEQKARSPSDPKYLALRARYLEMPELGRQLFQDVRDAYREQADETDRLLLDNIRKAQEVAKYHAERDYKARLAAIEAEDSNQIDKRRKIEAAQSAYKAATTRGEWGSKARMTMLRKMFESNRVQDPYFPLARFGDYFASVREKSTVDDNGNIIPGHVLHFGRYESKAQMDRALRDLQTEFAGDKVEITSGRLSKSGEIKQAMDPRVIGELDRLLQNSGVSDDIRDALYQRWLETMPDLSMRKRAIHRKGTAGFNTDAYRVYANTAFHAGHQMARLKYGVELQENVNRAEEQAMSIPDNTREMALVNELQLRHAWVKNPQSGSLVNWVTSLGFVYYMGVSPAAAVVNASQTVMVGLPVLGSRFGFGKSSAALLKTTHEFLNAVKTEAKGANGALQFLDGLGDLRNAPGLSAQDKAAMDAFYQSGLIDRTMSHDLASIGETGTKYNPLRAKLMKIASWSFHKVEVYNRSVTALAAYRLARDAGQSHLEAINTAHALTYAAHFDMSNSSRPRLTQSDWMRALTMFRSFQINMLFRIGRDMYQAVKAESPQARREARWQLAGITGMMALNAGLTGTIGYGFVMAAAEILRKMFGDDDDPLSFQERFKSDLMDILGPRLGGIVLNGVPGELLGIDLTSRIGMPDLWLRSSDRDLEGDDLWNYWVEQTAGAAVGMGHNIYSGLGMMLDGKIERGIEKMVPKFARDLMRTGRYAADGVQSLRGDQVIPANDVNWRDLTAQALGFTPSKISDAYDVNNTMKNAEKRMTERKRQIVNAFAEAVENGDAAGREKALEKIRKYNASPINRLMPITAQGLKQSLATRARNRSKTVNGVLIKNAALADYLQSQAAPQRQQEDDGED